MEHLITDWVGADLIDSITHTIIQSVWQGTIIGFIIWMIYRTKASSNPNTKYKIALLGIISLFIISMITFGMCYSTGGSIKTAQVTDTISSWTSNLVTLDAESGTITNAWIGYLWFLGVIGFSIKFLLDLFLVQYIRYTAITTGTTHRYQQRLNDIALSTNVKLKVSRMIQSPVTIGFIKPIVLFPIGMLTQLTVTEVESILRHEMAHIIRKDYLVNIIQSMIEIVLFYHPLVWWLSRVTREQREYCCDDVALAQNSAIDYAKTLVKIQELAIQQRQSLAMSFADQSMMNRIKRILNLPKSNKNMKEKLIAIVAVIGLLVIFSKDMIANVTEKIWSKVDIEYRDVPREKINLDMEIMKIDTLPKISKHSYSMTKSDEDGSISVKKEDGKITSLEIDGKKIPPSDYNEYEEKIEKMQGGSKRHGNIWIFRNGEDFDSEELEEKLEQLGIEIEEWGEQFGEEFGESMEEWGEDFGKSMEIWGKQFEDGFEWHMEDGDSSRAFSFVIPEMDEDIMIRLDDIMEGIDMEGLKIMELEGMTEGLSEMLEGLELDDIDIHRFEGNHDHHRGKLGTGRTVEDKIGYELRKDRLIATGEVSEIELSGKHMKVNGDKQPKNIWNKYKEIFEEESGIILSKDSKLKFKVEGKKTIKKSSAF